MQIENLSAEQLKALIRDTVEETLEEYFGDPDEGKEVKVEVKQRLLEIRRRREAGKRGIPSAQASSKIRIKSLDGLRY